MCDKVHEVFRIKLELKRIWSIMEDQEEEIDERWEELREGESFNRNLNVEMQL